MADFLELLGIRPAVETQPWPGPQAIPSTPLEAAAAPVPGITGAVNPGMQPSPPATPEEFEARKIGWMQKLTDPNFLRALGYAGSMMMQPVQPGQTKMGNLGRAFTVGRTAYDLGEQEQFGRQQAEARERRAGEEHKVGMRTKTVQANVAEATQEDVIAKAKTEAEKATFDLKKAKSEEEVAAIERQVRQRAAEIQKTIPDARVREAALAELQKPIAEVDRIRAAAQANRASAGASGAHQKLFEVQAGAAGTEAEIKKKELDAIKGMSNEQFLQYKSKTGKYSGTRSTWDAQMETYNKMYDAETPPEKQTEAGRAAYIKKFISKHNFASVSAAISRLAAQGVFEDHPELQAEMLEMLRDAMPGREGQRATPAAAPKAGAPQVNEVRQGYRFKGGDPADKANWVKVNP